MSIDIEKIKAFRRLYVATHQLVLQVETMLQQGERAEQLVEQAIDQVDKLIGMLPLAFPVMEFYKVKLPFVQKDGQKENEHNVFQEEGDDRTKLILNERVLLINPEDGDNEPTVKPYIPYVTNPYYIIYVIPKNTHVLYEITALPILEDWKFKIWNKVADLSTDPVMRKKYLPLALAQATHCISVLPDIYPYALQYLHTSYLSHIGRYAYLQEEDPSALEQALLTMEKEFEPYYYDIHMEETRALLLLKLGRNADAYPIIEHMPDRVPDYKPSLHLKSNKDYVAWRQEKDRKDKEMKEERKKAYQAFQQFITDEQEKVVNQFENPEHPLVIKYAAMLSLIKQHMVSIRYRTVSYSSAYQTDNPEPFKNAYVLSKCSPQQLEQFEIKHGLHLPDELKAYLMEIGEGGPGYFRRDGIYLYKLAGKLQVEGLTFQEPGLYLGRTWDGNQLYVISKGEFEGEVWVHTQEEAGTKDCFDVASPQRFTFLPFIAACLLTNYNRRTDNPDHSYM